MARDISGLQGIRHGSCIGKKQTAQADFPQKHSGGGIACSGVITTPARNAGKAGRYRRIISWHGQHTKINDTI